MTNDPLGADAILERVRRVYGTCFSCQDTGEVEFVMSTGPRPCKRVTLRKLFRTAFVRPDRFRFEFREMIAGPESEWLRCVILSDGSSFRSWMATDRALEIKDPLDRALAGATEISGGSACAIPSQLRMNVAWSEFLPEPSRTEFIGKEIIDGRECFVVRTTPRGRDPNMFWVDAQHFLIRRTRTAGPPDQDQRQVFLDRRHAIAEVIRETEDLPPDMRVEMLNIFEEPVLPQIASDLTTHYRPRVDASVDDANWSFEPPC